MFGRNKKNKVEDKNNIVIENMIDPNQQNQVTNPPLQQLSLDEKTVKIITDNGAIERLAKIPNTSMIEKLIVKNYCVYADENGKINEKLEIILRKKLNLSVSSGINPLINEFMRMNKPEITDINRQI